jgi:hypothetical protein
LELLCDAEERALLISECRPGALIALDRDRLRYHLGKNKYFPGLGSVIIAPCGIDLVCGDSEAEMRYRSQGRLRIMYLSPGGEPYIDNILDWWGLAA